MIVSNKHPIIAREGLVFVVACILLVLVLLLTFHLFVAAIFLLLTSFLLFLFRDPSRSIPPSPLGLVSPVDGVITSVSKKVHPEIGEKSICIEISVAPLGVYSIRSPIEGKLIRQWQQREDNVVQYFNWVQTDEGDNILWAIKAKSKNRASCYVQPGERIGQGQRCGFILFFTGAELYVSAGSQTDVSVGEKVKAGESILAHIVHRNGARLIGDAILTAENAE